MMKLRIRSMHFANEKPNVWYACSEPIGVNIQSFVSLPDIPVKSVRENY